MKSYPLNPSPIAVIRTRYRLSQADAARRLDLTEGQLRVLEMHSCEVPPTVLDAIDALLGPLSRFEQISIWDALEALDRGEGRSDA